MHQDAGELKTLYVHPSLRRRGLGRRLVDMAMQRAREAGKPRMILWSDTRLRDAHRLYRAMGFREHGVRMLFDTQDSIELGFDMPLATTEKHGSEPRP
jgi:putative acetyltransferase